MPTIILANTGDMYEAISIGTVYCMWSALTKRTVFPESSFECAGATGAMPADFTNALSSDMVENRVTQQKFLKILSQRLVAICHVGGYTFTTESINSNWRPIRDFDKRSFKKVSGGDPGRAEEGRYWTTYGLEQLWNQGRAVYFKWI